MAKQLWRRTYQVGVVVRDLDRAIRFFEQAGVGPFAEGPSAHTVERQIYGQPAPDVSVRGAVAPMGSIEFELLQPVTGRSIQAEFLEERGEGVLHLCGHTDDLERDMQDLTERGFPIISYGRLSDGGRFAYFDTRETGGLVLELFEPGSEWQ